MEIRKTKLPKTEIRYSRIYNQILNPKFKRQDMFKLKKKFSKFEKLYKKYIKKILMLIEKHNNKWKKEHIPIYLVDKAKHSFSNPLTIRYNKNEKFLLVVLAHELLHNNLRGKWKSKAELHKHMEPILNKVIKELSINLEKELIKFNKSIRKRYEY